MVGEEPPTPFQLRVKAGAFVATAAVTAALLLYDWGQAPAGRQDNVFSGIRPALKSFLNQLYGVSKPSSAVEGRSKPGSEEAAAGGAR